MERPGSRSRQMRRGAVMLDYVACYVVPSHILTRGMAPVLLQGACLLAHSPAHPHTYFKPRRLPAWLRERVGGPLPDPQDAMDAGLPPLVLQHTGGPPHPQDTAVVGVLSMCLRMLLAMHVKALAHGIDSCLQHLSLPHCLPCTSCPHYSSSHRWTP